jgi:hypothetical protein
MYLLAVARASPSQDLGLLGPPETGSPPIAPSTRTSWAALTYLHDSGIIHVDPASPIDAFDWESGNPINNFDLSRVAWRIAPDESGVPLVAALDEKLRVQAWNPSWTNEVAELWRAIVLEEATEFLLLSLDDHQLVFSPGEKTSMVLAAALENYSLARVWGVIWRAAKDAAAARARGVERWKAAAWAITSIQAYMERAVAQKWDLNPYRRHWRAPQSTLSQVFFGGLLRLPGYEDKRPSATAVTGHVESAPAEPSGAPSP